MMKRILTIVIITLLAGPTHAKSRKPHSGAEGEAPAALPVEGATRAPLIDEQQVDKIQSTYQGLRDLQADFTQNIFVKSLGRSVKNTGTLWIKKPGKIRIEYRGDTPRQYVSDGKYLWIYTPGESQAMRQKIGAGGVPREALAFLNGFGTLRQQFEIIKSAQQSKQTTMTLVPKKRSGFRQLNCVFNAQHLLSTMIVHNTSGGTARYNFSKTRTNRGLANHLFTFSPSRKVKTVRN